MSITAVAAPIQEEMEVVRRQRGRSHLPSARFRVARDLNEVLAAWRMVYQVYVGSGLIHPNPFNIHTTPQTLSQSSAVFHGSRADSIESTLTAVVDGPMGLPMDCVYKHDIDVLRHQGKTVTEYGLFAHVRQLPAAAEPLSDSTHAPSSRVQCSVIHLMRLAFYFALAHDSTDFIVGVHPKHARFYNRAFGFRQIGQLRTCPTVNHKPVVLLYANLRKSLEIDPLPYVLQYCLEHPVTPETFEDRCRLTQGELSDEALSIQSYLEERGAMKRRVAG